MMHVMDGYLVGEKPEVGMIKKKIDTLIEREYIERVVVQDLKAVYRYIA
jgi:hypothetical protein